MKLNVRSGDTSLKLVLFFLCFIVLVPVSPALQPIPHRDSGVFLYIGQGILDGKIPYLDFWDHKGPLIYYINALGLFLYKESYWGVWLVEIFSLTLCAMLSFSLLKSRFNKTFAFIGTAAWVLALGKIFTVQFGAGNHVEEYALFLYVAQIYLFLQKKDNATNIWRLFFVGVCAALCVLLRPNLISPLVCIYMSILSEMLIFKKEGYLKHFQALIILTSGLTLTLAVVLFYFWCQSALYDLFYDVILYNLYYSGSGQYYLKAFVNSFKILGLINIAGLAAWIMLLLFPRKMSIITGDPVLTRFFIFLPPVEIVLSLLSGYGYIHYYISWLPILGILLCIFMASIQYFIESLHAIRLIKQYSWVGLCLIFLLQAMPFIKDLQIYSSVIIDKFNTGKLFLTDNRRSPEWDDINRLYDIIPRNTEVIFWGNEVEYNFIMGLPSPTRYIYLYPMMDNNYATSSMKNELLSAIKEKQPVIIDIQPSSTPAIQSLAKWAPYPNMLPVIHYVKNNYHISQEIHVISYYYAKNQLWSLTHKWTIWIHN